VRLQLRGRTLDLTPGAPAWMGIVNATPDSFSDSQSEKTLPALVEQALGHVESGAAIVDVGGESGRTDRALVGVEEEIARVVPLVRRLASEGVAVSVDTWRAPVAHAALEAGAVLINDVSGLSDPAIAGACAETGAGLVITHTRIPPKVKGFPVYDDVVEDVLERLGDRAALALDRGVRAEQLLLDPGIDLAKTPAESIELLRRLSELESLGRPLLLAISRKDFIGVLTGRSPREREAGTLAAVEPALDVATGAMLRVHDVRAGADFVAVRTALRGTAPLPAGALDEALRRESAPGQAVAFAARNRP
jgi:dihydropteroate synthase